MSLKCLLLFCFIRITLADQTLEPQGQGPPDQPPRWDYKNIDKWIDDYPLCASTESPININTSSMIINVAICTLKFEWDIHYNHTLFKVVNNGHTLTISAIDWNNYENLSFRRRLLFSELNHIDLNSNSYPIAEFTNYFASSNSPHKKFCLDSFHFHWGKSSEYGSEHTINGKHFPLEVQFVHFSCDYSNIAEALDAYHTNEDKYVLGIVSIMYEPNINDTDNLAFDVLLNDEMLSQIKYPDEFIDTNIGITYVDNLDLNDLIPENVETDGYFQYDGSLTSPPCTDAVRWFIMKAGGYISEQQLDRFRKLMTIGEDGNFQPITPNYRGIQKNINDVHGCLYESVTIVKIVPEATEKGLNMTSIIILSIGGCVFCTLLFGVCICAKRESEPDHEIHDISDVSDLDISDIEQRPQID